MTSDHGTSTYHCCWVFIYGPILIVRAGGLSNNAIIANDAIVPNGDIVVNSSIVANLDIISYLGRRTDEDVPVIKFHFYASFWAALQLRNPQRRSQQPDCKCLSESLEILFQEVFLLSRAQP